MTSKPLVTSELSRELSLFHITMMGLGMMIGAGVFLGVGRAISVAGPGGVVLTFALNGVIALFTAMSYAELSSAIPRAGGAYNFARIAFGRGPSFIAGWMEWFASSVAGSMYAVVFSIYVLRYLGVLGLLGWLPESVSIVTAEKALAVIVACFFLYINYRGASETGKVGAFFTLGQTLFMVLIGIVGIVVCARDPSRLANFNPFLPRGWTKLLVTMGFTYVAFEGYEVIAQAGDEAIAPRRNLPKAMLYSVLIVTLTYVAVSFATVVAVKAGSPDLAGRAPWEWIGSFQERGFGEAVAKLTPKANLLLTLAVIFASTSALNATIYSAARASYALGRDRMLPGALALISKTRRTPWVALVATGAIVLVMILALETADVAPSASIMFLILFFLVNLSAIKIRRNMSDELTYGFLMPFFPLPPVIAIFAQVMLAAWMHEASVVAYIVAAVWVGAGVLVYFLYSRSCAVATEDEIHVLEEEHAPKGDEYRIMVAVANPKNALELVRNTYKLCGAKRARVELLHMVPVPDQVPLADALKNPDRYTMTGKEGIVEAMLYLSPLFPITTTIRYCRNMARGIVSAVREKRIDMLIMGWHGRPGAHAFSLGSTVDPIIENTPCDVVVLKDCSDRKFKRVLAALGGGPNSALSLELATILADGADSEIVALNVFAERSRFDVSAFVIEQGRRLHLPADRIITKAVQAPSVADAIVRESEDFDVVVIGCQRDRKLFQLTRGEPIPELVAWRCNKPLVMVRAAAGIRSWIKRWI